MTGLRPSALLEVLERGAGSTVPARALTLLEAAGSGDCGGLSPGERDAALLGLRRELFGDSMRATASCDSCGEVLELELEVEDLVVAPPVREAHRVVASGDFEVTVRLPSSVDLAIAASLGDGGLAEDELLARAVVEARRGEEKVDVAQLPDEVIESVDDALGEMDPQGALDVRTTCPGCGTEQSVAFDAASYVAAEVDWAARRLVTEIHDLATAYGWTEDDVLALPPGRRRRYVELVRG